MPNSTLVEGPPDGTSGAPDPVGRLDVLLVCSSGGHLLQLLALREAWDGLSHLWVSDDTSDVHSLLAGESLVLAYGPTARNVSTLIKNLRLALRICRRYRPRSLVATGAATSVPFVWVGRILGAKIVYVESLTRIERPSLACRLSKPFAHRVYVQWPELATRMRGSVFVGSVLAER